MKQLRILAWLLVMCMTLSGLAVAASAEEQATGGDWENVTWNYNTETGELRISGEGEMPSLWPIYFPWTELDIKSVVIEEGITSVSRQAFERNSNLTSVTLPNSLVRIDMFAFQQTGLTSINIPAGVTDIANNAFQNCKDLKEYVVDPANTAYSNDEHGVLFNKDKTALKDLPDAFQGDYVIPDSVTQVWKFAFEYCDALTGLYFPAGTEIPFEELSQTPGLKRITVDPNHSNYSNDDKGILFNKDKTELLKIPNGYEGHYDIPDGVVTIGDRNLPTAGCSKLTSISIPASTTNIAYYWDYDILPGSNLEKITVHKDNPNYCDDHGVLYNKDMTTLLRIPEGFKGGYTIPATVSKIAYEAAYFCKNLTSVTIMGELENIGAWAFSDCENLAEIWFRGNAPQNFGSECFYGVTAKAYYPADNATWTEEVMTDDNHYGDLTWEVDPCSVAHTEVVDKGKEATCTKTGLTDGKHCSLCGKVTLKQESTPAIGHDFGEWEQIKAPTTESKGLSERTCVNCGDQERMILDALPPAPTETEPAVTEPAQTEPTGEVPAPTEPAQNQEPDNDINTVVIVVAVVALGGAGGAGAIILVKKFRA